MTGRRRSYLQHWAPLHNMTVEEATANFPKEAGIARYGEPEEIAGADGVPGLAGRALDDRFDASHGWRRGEIDLTKARRRPPWIEKKKKEGRARLLSRT